MAEKGLNCGINKTIIMATNITVPDIGEFDNVEIINGGIATLKLLPLL